MDFVGKPNDLVGTVAEGLVGGVAATAKRDFRPAGEPEGFSSGIDDLEVTFDPQRTVVRGSDFRCGHGCLRQKFSGGAPSNKPLRYVGARPNSTRGFFALTVLQHGTNGIARVSVIGWVVTQLRRKGKTRLKSDDAR